MWIINSQLQPKPVTNRSYAPPLFTIVGTENYLDSAPLCTLSYFESNDGTGTELPGDVTGGGQSGSDRTPIEIIEDPPPTQPGLIYELPGPCSKLGNYSQVTDLLKLGPGNYFTNSELTYLCISKNTPLTVGSIVTGECTYTVLTPQPITTSNQESNYAIPLQPGLFSSITCVESEGLVYLPAEEVNNPLPHEFVFSNGILYLYAVVYCRPRLNSDLVITGNKIYTVPYPKFASFVFDYSGIQQQLRIEAILYENIRYIPNITNNEIKANTFFFDLFTKQALLFRATV